MLIHGVGSSIELFVGMCAILLPEWSSLAYLSAALALLVNVPSGFMLTPRVYGAPAPRAPRAPRAAPSCRRRA